MMTPAGSTQSSRAATPSSNSDGAASDEAGSEPNDGHTSYNSALDDSDLFENEDSESCDAPFPSEVFTQRVEVRAILVSYVLDETFDVRWRTKRNEDQSKNRLRPG